MWLRLMVSLAWVRLHETTLPDSLELAPCLQHGENITFGYSERGSLWNAAVGLIVEP